MTLTKAQRLFKKVLDDAAADLGVVGEFKVGTRHDHYCVVLPSNDVVKMTVWCTPRNTDGYARTLPARLKHTIAKFCKERGVT